MSATAPLTSPNNYFEDFAPGDLWRHRRGKTVTEMDNVLLTNLVMNTAEGHFNEHAMQQGASGIFAQRVVFGGINLSMTLGLARRRGAPPAGRPAPGRDRARGRRPRICR